MIDIKIRDDIIKTITTNVVENLRTRQEMFDTWAQGIDNLSEGIDNSDDYRKLFRTNDTKSAENFLTSLGVDISQPGTKDTPRRIIKAYRELFKGLYEPPPTLTTFPNENATSDIIMSDCIPFASVCEHHILPFTGMCWVLYIPNSETVIGFSKFARIVSHFAARPQIQERLVAQIADYIEEVANPKGVMIFSRAKHSCAMCRGARSGPTNGLTTSTVRGEFERSSDLELKGLEMIKLSISLEGKM